MSANTKRGQAHPGGAVALGICDYCGKRRPVHRLDDRAYVACAPCAMEIHCYQAVTDEEALADESASAPRRRRRRRPAAVAQELREWVSPLGEPIERGGVASTAAAAF